MSHVKNMSHNFSPGLTVYTILFLIPTSFYLLIVGVEGYCSNRPHTPTHTHTNYGSTSLDEGTARHRHLYLTTPSIQNIQTSMHPAGFELAVPASERPQTHVFAGTFTAIQNTVFYFYLLSESFNYLYSQEIWGVTLNYSVQEALHMGVVNTGLTHRILLALLPIVPRTKCGLRSCPPHSSFLSCVSPRRSAVRTGYLYLT